MLPNLLLLAIASLSTVEYDQANSFRQNVGVGGFFFLGFIMVGIFPDDENTPLKEFTVRRFRLKINLRITEKRKKKIIIINLLSNTKREYTTRLYAIFLFFYLHVSIFDTFFNGLAFQYEYHLLDSLMNAFMHIFTAQ